MKRILIILIAALTLCSCSPLADVREENTGKLVTPDELEDVSEAQGKKEIIYRDIDENYPVYFWSQNGSVFHSTADCSSLANSKTVICGNINHAYTDGIDKTCSRCFEKNDG